MRFLPKEVYHESRVAAPSLRIASRSFLTVQRMCEWKSSLCSSLHPRFTVLTEGGGWVGVLRWQENWNGTPRSCRLRCHSLMKTPVLFSLAICLLQVSIIVKLCVICCDSFIILESADVAPRCFRDAGESERCSVALDKCMQHSSKAWCGSLASLEHIRKNVMLTLVFFIQSRTFVFCCGKCLCFATRELWSTWSFSCPIQRSTYVLCSMRKKLLHSPLQTAVQQVH